jgi:hypothetical protein
MGIDRKTCPVTPLVRIRNRVTQNPYYALAMPLNQKLCIHLLRRLGLLNCRKLLLELRKEVLARWHQVRHVACAVLDGSSLVSAQIPREPHAPLLLFATESPWTLWYTDWWSGA